MQKLPWFERVFKFGLPVGMLPFYIERLESALPRTKNKVKGISEEKISARLSNKWSIKENIAHLAEVDGIALTLIEEMILRVSTLSRAVFEPMPYHGWEARIQNVTRYRTLSLVDLGKFAMHPRLSLCMTPVDLGCFHAEHDDQHLVRIGEILSQLSK